MALKPHRAQDKSRPAPVLGDLNGNTEPASQRGLQAGAQAAGGPGREGLCR